MVFIINLNAHITKKKLRKHQQLQRSTPLDQVAMRDDNIDSTCFMKQSLTVLYLSGQQNAILMLAVNSACPCLHTFLTRSQHEAQPDDEPLHMHQPMYELD